MAHNEALPSLAAAHSTARDCIGRREGEEGGFCHYVDTTTPPFHLNPHNAINALICTAISDFFPVYIMEGLGYVSEMRSNQFRIPFRTDT